MKRIAAIHDISGVGKCSLTAAIPVISAFGIECNPVPTAVLSTHTGNLEGYTFRDLTDDIIPYCRHWKSLGIVPDAVYTGYLGSLSQIDAVKQVIEMFEPELVVVDPAMADGGELYRLIDSSFPSRMAELCGQAHIIIPNITEACLLTGIPYREQTGEDYVTALLEALYPLCRGSAVLTGVSFTPGEIGAAVYDGSEISYVFTEKYPGTYYGTGDIFASVLTACVLSGKTCREGAEAAAEFTSKCIGETYRLGTDPRLGVAFEKFLPDLMNLR